jgi:sterol desaturase/sphingolipid hydroxylase (fatty acid hydroxylase superfamily)
MIYIFAFLLWTLYLYWIHRILHSIPSFARDAHLDHHRFINIHGKTTWHWNNLFLFNDTWTSTMDLWITEVVPTVIFSYVTGYWWLSVFYYVWAAFIQEVIEHNPKFNIYPLLTSGQWHLVHHKQSDKNFGLFVPIWDIIFRTYKTHKVTI